VVPDRGGVASCLLSAGAPLTDQRIEDLLAGD
jgi:hypothetical protein